MYTNITVSNTGEEIEPIVYVYIQQNRNNSVATLPKRKDK